MTAKEVGLVGARIRRRRELLLVSQEELAATLGVHQQALARWEMEKVDPASLVVRRLATALECTSDYLLGLVDDPGETKERSELSPEQRKLLWLIDQGLNMDAIALIAGIGKGAQ